MKEMLELIANFTEMGLMMFFYAMVLGKRRDILNKHIFTGVYIVAYTIWHFCTFPPEIWYANTLMCLLITFLLALMYDCKNSIRIFAVVIYFVLGIATEVMAMITISFTGNDFVDIEIEGNIIARMYMLLIVIAISLLFKRKIYIIDKSTVFFMILIPILSVFSICITIQYVIDGENTVQMGMHGLLIVIINILMFYILNRVSENSMLKEQDKMLTKQMDYQKKKYDQTLESFTTINAILHDTNKHMVFLKELIKNNKNENAIEYIHKFTDKIKDSYVRFNTESLVLDSLLNNAVSIAESNNAVCDTKIHVDGTVIKKIEEYDMCVILGNILDNANIAVAECDNDNKKISINISTSDVGLHLVVTNTYAEQKNDEKKSEDIFHGYGLCNVKNTVEKYGGYVTVEHDGSTYTTYVTLTI